MLDAIDEDINAGVITQAEGDRLREEKMKAIAINLDTSRFAWVDEEFRQWVHSRMTEGQVDALIPIDDGLKAGVNALRKCAERQGVWISENVALEVFALCAAYYSIDGVHPRETLAQALNACRRRAAKVGQG